jgi:hypothetical protein
VGADDTPEDAMQAKSRISHAPMRRAVGWVALAGGGLVALFWLLYFTTTTPLGHADPMVVAYEAAFPLADAGFAATLLLAGYGLLRGHAAGPFLLVGAAAVSVYLGILDLTFYAGHGLYARMNPSVLLELGVNAACLGGGLLGLHAGWRWWRADATPAG